MGGLHVGRRSDFSAYMNLPVSADTKVECSNERENFSLPDFVRFSSLITDIAIQF